MSGNALHLLRATSVHLNHFIGVDSFGAQITLHEHVQESTALVSRSLHVNTFEDRIVEQSVCVCRRASDYGGNLGSRGDPPTCTGPREGSEVTKAHKSVSHFLSSPKAMVDLTTACCPRLVWETRETTRSGNNPDPSSVPAKLGIPREPGINPRTDPVLAVLSFVRSVLGPGVFLSEAP